SAPRQSPRCAGHRWCPPPAPWPSRDWPAPQPARPAVARPAPMRHPRWPAGLPGTPKFASWPHLRSHAASLPNHGASVYHCRSRARRTNAVISNDEALSYRAAGVDIDAGNAVVERIKPLVGRTFRPEVMGGLGGFGALFDLSKKYREPVLVSGTDGVDLVGMCVNDVLVQGAEPLFFLDYFATGKLDVDTTVSVVGGIAKGCE